MLAVLDFRLLCPCEVMLMIRLQKEIRCKIVLSNYNYMTITRTTIRQSIVYQYIYSSQSIYNYYDRKTTVFFDFFVFIFHKKVFCGSNIDTKKNRIWIFRFQLLILILDLILWFCFETFLLIFNFHLVLSSVKWWNIAE